MLLLNVFATLTTAGGIVDQAALDPVGPWTVEVEENLCMLSHRYGLADASVIVGFQPMVNLDQMEVVVIGPQGARTQRAGRGTLSFSSGESLEGYHLSLPMKKKRRYTRLTVSAEALDWLSADRELRIRADPIDVRVRLPATDKAMALLKACQDRLVRSWGLDPATLSPDRAPAPISPEKVFRPGDYPVDALRGGNVGRVTAVVQVDADGKATHCRMVSSAGKVLDEVTCRRAMAVRFKPGTDAAGNPVASAAVLQVRWSLGM